LQPIAIFAPVYKQRPVQAARKLLGVLGASGVPVRLRRDLAHTMRRPELGVDDDQIAAGVALVISLGGDGTTLAAARAAAPAGAPVIGVNIGGFGFLTELGYNELYDRLPELLQGRYQVQERMMLAAAITRGGRALSTLHGLNDLVITKGALSRLVRLSVTVNGQALGTFPADGIIVSTPAGSTAYSLSAGGPLVAPEVRVLVVTPICPHTLSMRPLVLPGEAALELGVGPLQSDQQFMATLDGQIGVPLEPGDLITVRQAPFSARLVTLGGPGFYQKLRTKLRWGGES